MKSNPSSDEGASPPSKVPRTRISRACENCRARRKKCQPPYPCQGCRDAGLTDCLVRDRARPLRRRRSQQASSAPIEGGAFPQRTRFLDVVDHELEAIYESQRGGETISLALEERPTHPALDLSTPAPPLPDPLPPSAAEAMQCFTDNLLPYCSFMTPPRVLALFERYVQAPSTLSPDQTALILACLALGYIRLQGFQPDRLAQYVPIHERMDVPYFRSAVETLETWGGSSFTSLHALSAMWFYATLACDVETTRVIMSWSIAQSKDLGIHKEDALLASSYSPADRADLMFVQVLYSHYITTSQTDRAPILRPGEFENMSFRSRPVMDNEVVVLVPKRALTELLALNTQLIISIHDPKNPQLSLDWLLRVEERWENWMSRYVADGRTTGNVYTDPFVGVLWDWGRITLRLLTMNDRRLAVSSLSILARAATKILAAYSRIYQTSQYNLVWQHLRHIVTCAHIALLCYWRFEMTKAEAEDAVGSATWMLSLMEPRWGRSVTEAIHKLNAVAEVMGLNPAAPATPSQTLTPFGLLPDGGVDPSTLGILYEAFDPAYFIDPGTSANTSATVPDTGGWTIDSLFLGDMS